MLLLCVDEVLVLLRADEAGVLLSAPSHRPRRTRGARASGRGSGIPEIR
jgi:hypothetical protein